MRRNKRPEKYDDTNFAVLNALNYELTQAEQETIASKIQSSLESATDTYLDTWGDWFGVYRKDGWDDEYYRARIIRELLLKRGTIPAIIDALVDFLNDNDAVVQIYEPWRNIFYTNKSKLNGDDHLMGYYYRFAIIDISIDRPFPPEIVEIIKAFKPAGVLFYLRLDTSLDKNKTTVESPYVYLDVTNKTELEFLNGLYYDLRGNINLSDQRTQVVGNNIFHTNNSKLNGEDVLAGAFNHGRGYVHLASTTLLDYTPKATDSMSNLKTTLGEAGSDMYNQTKEKDDRTASIQVPATKNVHTLYSNSIDFGDYDYSGNPNLTPPLSFASFPDKTSDVTLTDEGDGILIESDGSRQLSTTTRSFTPLKNYTNYVMTAQVMVESGFEGNISDLQINYRWLVQDVSDTVWISLGFEDVQPDTWTTLTAQGRSQYNLKGRPYLQIRSKIGTTFKGKLHIKYNIKIEEGVVSTAYQPNLIAEPYFLSNIPINKNMLKAWDAPITGTEYLIGSYEPIKPLEKGTTYTITLNGTKPDNQRFGIYNNNSNGNHLLGYVDPVLGVNNTYRLTFTYSNSTLEELGKIRVYQYPSGTAGNCIINWAKLELGGVATPPIESYTYTGTLVNNTEQPVTDPKKYSWSTETSTNNKKAYMVFDIRTFIEENYATEFEKLVADLGEDQALNAVFENFSISTALKALVSPSSPINFSVELYDFSTSTWHKLNTDSLDLRMRTFNLVANRITDYLNDYKLLFVRYVFDNETDKDVTVELDMLNVLFNYRLGDGYSLGLQSTVECLSEIPLKRLALSSESVEVAIGETAKVTATPVPANATNKSLEWEIADPKTATVDTSGNITGVAIGETTSTVYGEDRTISSTCSVSVKARHTLYSNSTDFGNYDYSGNPNLMRTITFSDLSTMETPTGRVPAGVTDKGDYFEIDLTTMGVTESKLLWIPMTPRPQVGKQYTYSIELMCDEGEMNEVYIRPCYRNANGVVVANFNSITTAVTSTWQRYSKVSYKATDEMVNSTLQALQFYFPPAVTRRKLYVRYNIMVQEGDQTSSQAPANQMPKTTTDKWYLPTSMLKKVDEEGNVTRFEHPVNNAINHNVYLQNDINLIPLLSNQKQYTMSAEIWLEKEVNAQLVYRVNDKDGNYKTLMVANSIGTVPAKQWTKVSTTQTINLPSNPNLIPTLKASDFYTQEGGTIEDSGNGLSVGFTKTDGAVWLETRKSMYPVKPNTNYTMSADVTISEGYKGSLDNLRITYRKYPNGTIIIPLTCKDAQVGKKTKISITVNSSAVTDPSDFVRMYLAINTTSTDPFIGTALIENIKVEEGEAVTPDYPQHWFQINVAQDYSGIIKVKNDSIKIQEGATTTTKPSWKPNLLDAPYYLSKVPLGENLADPTVEFPITSSVETLYSGRAPKDFVEGETYTVTIGATKPSTQSFGVYLALENNAIFKPVDGLLNTWTATLRIDRLGEKKNAVYIYQSPRPSVGACQIDWLKIEKGDTRTPNIDSYAYRGTVLTTSEESPKDPNAYTWSSI